MKQFLIAASALLALALGAPLTASATPLFQGADDFDGGSSGRWSYAFRIEGSSSGNGDLAFTNDRLDFSKGAGAGSLFRGWDGNPTSPSSRSPDSFDNSWVMDLQVTNNVVLGGGEFANIGFEVVYQGGPEFYALFLSSSGAGTNVRVEASGRSLRDVATPSSTADLFLRMPGTGVPVS